MTTIEIHHCPRCDLRFTNGSEVEDHLYRDHQVEMAVRAAPSTRDATAATVTHGLITVPVDPQRPTSPAVHVAGTVARQSGFSLDLVAAVPPGFDETATRTYLRKQADELDDQASATCESLGSGDPADAVIDHVRTRGTSMICMATHSRTAVTEIAFGSVSQAVTRRSPVPVLLCGPHIEPAERYDRILVGLDGSDLAERALTSAIDLAQAMGNSVELLSVLDPDVEFPPDLLEAGYLSRVSRSSPMPIDAFEAIHDSNPGRALADAAAARSGTILAVGTQGKTGFQRLRLGSVAVAAVRHATCPVLLVPLFARLPARG